MSHARDVTEAKTMKVLAIYGGEDRAGPLGRPGFRIGWGSVFGNPNDSGGWRVLRLMVLPCCLTLSWLKPVPQDRDDSAGPPLLGPSGSWCLRRTGFSRELGLAIYAWIFGAGTAHSSRSTEPLRPATLSRYAWTFWCSSSVVNKPSLVRRHRMSSALVAHSSLQR
jgi:hypothetical protein